MTQLKRLIVFCLSAIFILGAAACGRNSGDSGGGGKSGGQIKIIIQEKGFGTEWLNDMADTYYKATGTKVTIKKDYLEEIKARLESGTLVEDIAMQVGSFYSSQSSQKLADLTSVYNTIPQGEELTIREKTNTYVYNQLLTEDNKIYQMNWASSVSGIIYNKTVLDKYFPEGYTIPRTTDELIEFCNQIKQKGIYAFSFSTGVPYSSYVYTTWWAQHEGLDKYYDYYNGYYYNDDGIRTLALNGEIFDAKGREESLKVALNIFDKNKGYVHKYADSMTFSESQIAFLSQGYKGKDNTEAAMIINGSWLENEMGKYLAVKPQEIRFMKLPVISTIVDRLQDKTITDSKLRELIEAIDNNEESLEGISPTDFNSVKEARKMTYSSTYDHGIAVRANSPNLEKAKDFLVFMASEQGQAIYSRKLNGLTMPYGYKPGSNNVSNFVNSIYELFADDYIPLGYTVPTPLTTWGGLGPYPFLVDPLLFAGTSVSTILNNAKQQYMIDWNKTIKFA